MLAVFLLLVPPNLLSVSVQFSVFPWKPTFMDSLIGSRFLRYCPVSSQWECQQDLKLALFQGLFLYQSLLFPLNALSYRYHCNSNYNSIYGHYKTAPSLCLGGARATSVLWTCSPSFTVPGCLPLTLTTPS